MVVVLDKWAKCVVRSMIFFWPQIDSLLITLPLLRMHTRGKNVYSGHLMYRVLTPMAIDQSHLQSAAL